MFYNGLHQNKEMLKMQKKVYNRFLAPKDHKSHSMTFSCKGFMKSYDKFTVRFD